MRPLKSAFGRRSKSPEQRPNPGGLGVYSHSKFLFDCALRELFKRYGNYSDRGPTDTDYFKAASEDSRMKEAETGYRRALRMAADANDGSEIHVDVARAYHQLGFLYRLQGKFQDAQDCFAKSLDILWSIEPKSDDIERTLSDNLFRMAEIHHVQGAVQQARDLYQQSRSICERLGDSSDVRDIDRMLARLK